eukprot:2014117-Pleurochrysis_carterae.AAC.1
MRPPASISAQSGSAHTRRRIPAAYPPTSPRSIPPPTTRSTAASSPRAARGRTHMRIPRPPRTPPVAPP